MNPALPKNYLLNNNGKVWGIYQKGRAG